MKIENSDAFKKWLVKNLNTIFDGEPEKLALYIIALSKKFENDQASKERCCKDLEVFLESNTSQFVENLFSALVTNSYLNTSTSSNSSAALTAPPGAQTQTTNQTTTNNQTSATLNLTNQQPSQAESAPQAASSQQLDVEGASRKKDESRTSSRPPSDRSRRPSESRSSYKSRLSIDYQEIDVGTQGRRSNSSSRRKTRRNRYRTHRGLDSPNSSSSSSPTTTSGRHGDSYRRSFSRSRSRSLSGSPSPKNYELNDQAGQSDLGGRSSNQGQGGVDTSDGGNNNNNDNNGSNISSHSQYMYDKQSNNGGRSSYNQPSTGYHHHQQPSNYQPSNNGGGAGMGRGQMPGRMHGAGGMLKQPRRNMPPNQLQQMPNQTAGLLPLPIPAQMMSQQPNQQRYMNSMNQPPGMPNQPNFNQRPSLMQQPNPMGMGLMPNPNQPPPQQNQQMGGDNQQANFNQQQRPLMGINMNRQRNLVNIVTSLPPDGQADMFSQQQFQQPPPSLAGQFQQPPPQFQQPPPQFQQPPPSFQPQQPPPQFQQSNQFGQVQQQPPPGMMMPPGGASSSNMQQQTRGMKRSYNNANNSGQQSFNRNDGLMQTPNLMNPPPFINFNNGGGPGPGGVGQQQQQQQQPALLPTPNMAQMSHPPPPTPQHLQQPPPTLPPPTEPAQPQQQQQPQMNTSSSSSSSSSNQPVNPNTTLVVRKVPIELNRVEKMQEHFAQFGQLVDVRCQFDQHSDAALIQFATNAQALAAYKCPQPVFNNRFIRLFWYLNYQKQQSYLPQQQQQQMGQQGAHSAGAKVSQAASSDEPVSKKPVKERLGFVNKSQPPYAHKPSSHYTEAGEFANETRNKENQKEGETADQVANSAEAGEGSESQRLGEGEGEAPSSAPETNKNQQLASNFNSLSIEKKSTTTYTNPAIANENQKKALMLKLEVQKKARELIEKQIKDQKLLLQKFEQAKTVEEKSQILMLVKKLNESIEKEKEILNKKPISGGGPEGQSSLYKTSATPFSFQKHPKTTSLVVPPPPHSLKLNNKRLNNTNFLRNPYVSKAGAADKMAAVGTSKTLPSPISVAHVAAAASAGFLFQSYAKVDNRPKSLMITGIENNQEKTSLVNFVRSLGCQIDSVIDQQSEGALSSGSGGEQLSMQINFASRKDAEIALSKCSSSLNSKTISITWCKSEPAATATAAASSAKPATSILPDGQETGGGESTTKKTVSADDNDEAESQKSLQTPDVSVADILPTVDQSGQDDNTTNSESNDSIANLVRTATNNLKAEQDEEEEKDEQEEENVNMNVNIDVTDETLHTEIQEDDNDNANDNNDIFDMLFESKEDDAASAAAAASTDGQ